MELPELLQTSSTFPTYIEALELANDDLKLAMRSLDIFLHLPESVSRTPMLRNAIIEIDESMNKLAKPPVVEQKSSVPKHEKKPEPIRVSSGGGLFSTVMDPVVRVRAYIEKVKSELDSMMSLNKRSNLDLFFHLANGSSEDKIKEVIAKAKSKYASGFLQLVDAPYGNTALHIAALCCSGNIIQLLLQEGFTPDKKNENGNTPLQLAVLRQNKEAVQELVTSDVDVHSKNKEGYDSVILALAQKDQQIPVLLLKSGSFNPSTRY